MANKNKFYNAVLATPDISHAYCAGLKALGADSVKICPADPKLLDGSVDIDSATVKLYPEDARWDYAVGYDGKVYFIEIHPVNTSNVHEVLAKANWLTDWLKTKATELKPLMAGKSYYWVASGKYNISKNSPQHKRLAQSRVILKGSRMTLPCI